MEGVLRSPGYDHRSRIRSLSRARTQAGGRYSYSYSNPRGSDQRRVPPSRPLTPRPFPCSQPKSSTSTDEYRFAAYEHNGALDQGCVLDLLGSKLRSRIPAGRMVIVDRDSDRPDRYPPQKKPEPRIARKQRAAAFGSVVNALPLPREFNRYSVQVSLMRLAI